MSGSATVTIVMSTSSMKVPAHTATSGNHFRIFMILSVRCHRGDTSDPFRRDKEPGVTAASLADF
jgi:hypothetical protein